MSQRQWSRVRMYDENAFKFGAKRGETSLAAVCFRCRST